MGSSSDYSKPQDMGAANMPPTPPGWWQMPQTQQTLNQRQASNTPNPWLQLLLAHHQQYQPQASRFNNLQAPMGVPALAQPDQPYQPFEINA